MDKIAVPRQLLKLAKTIALNCRTASVDISVRNVLRRDARRLHTGNSRRKAAEQAREVAAVKNNLFEFHGDWPQDEQHNFLKDLRIVPNFISAEEESKLLEEIEPYMKRLHYEYDHWDDAIHGFRETERKQWYPHNRVVLERVREVAFDGEIMPFVHILDLAEQGVIKAHVDSTRYCGHTIAGMSLLSHSVMRLVRVDEQKYKQPPQVVDTDENSENNTNSIQKQQPASDEGNYRSQPKVTLENNFYADVLLQRRSLYIMSHSSRYNFSHEILANDMAKFSGQSIKKERRISIICRNEPLPI